MHVYSMTKTQRELIALIKLETEDNCFHFCGRLRELRVHFQLKNTKF